MLVVPGREGKDLCDSHLGMTRRAVLRVGGSGLFGMTLGSMFRLQAANAAAGKHGGAGWGQERRDGVSPRGPEPYRPVGSRRKTCRTTSAARSKAIPTKIPGVQFTEMLPKLAQVNDKFTMIRSMSYTPVGLFNHTAAIYQMMTGYTTDKVSPSGQLEPPTPKDFPNFGSNIIRLEAAEVPMLPFVMMPRRCKRATSSARPARRVSSARATIRTRSIRPATTWTWRRWKDRVDDSEACVRKFRSSRLESRAGCAK
jgi:hypothetical protein